MIFLLIRRVRKWRIFERFYRRKRYGDLFIVKINLVLVGSMGWRKLVGVERLLIIV